MIVKDLAVNQCQGCQAGWEAVDKEPFFSCDDAIVFHLVDGGYCGEMVLCTKDLYVESDK